MIILETSKILKLYVNYFCSNKEVDSDEAFINIKHIVLSSTVTEEDFSNCVNEIFSYDIDDRLMKLINNIYKSEIYSDKLRILIVNRCVQYTSSEKYNLILQKLEELNNNTKSDSLLKLYKNLYNKNVSESDITYFEKNWI